MQYRGLLSVYPQNVTCFENTNNVNNKKNKVLKPTSEIRTKSLETRILSANDGFTEERCENNSQSDTSTNIQIQLQCKSRQKVLQKKIRFSCARSTYTLLVLICLVVNLELVIGALNLNNNSVKYYKSTKNDTTVINDLPFQMNAIENNAGKEKLSSRSRVIYQNQFAVHIIGGIEKANEIAAKHGFINLGQVIFNAFFKQFILVISSFFP
jgi:Peptidase S8 pro-domain